MWFTIRSIFMDDTYMHYRLWWRYKIPTQFKNNVIIWWQVDFLSSSTNSKHFSLMQHQCTVGIFHCFIQPTTVEYRKKVAIQKLNIYIHYLLIAAAFSFNTARLVYNMHLGNQSKAQWKKRTKSIGNFLKVILNEQYNSHSKICLV